MTFPNRSVNTTLLRIPLILGGVLLALTACSQPQHSSEVASIKSSGTGGNAQTRSSAQNPDSDSGRPRLRMDMSEEEQARYWDVYDSCLVKEDPNVTKPGQHAGSVGQKVFYENASKAALDKCLPKMPLPPWEMDDKNPEFKDNWHRNVQCLKRKGLEVNETEPGSWTYAGQSSLSDAESAKAEKDCLREVFGGGK
jgi:hypothetical protein